MRPAGFAEAIKLFDETSAVALPDRAADDGARGPFEHALDWLADGVALLAGNGSVVYANHAFRAIAQRKDGITTRERKMRFAGAVARDGFERAVAGALQAGVRDAARSVASDFPVDRSGDAACYFVSVRPIAGDGGAGRAESRACVAVFIRDPSARDAAAIRILSDVLQLTEAEAQLAQALQSGARLRDYARARRISINTIYAHLRNIKQKTGSHRMSELIRRLNDLQAIARSG
jgi:DNA-binding CsgD family transcriptional regulator